ncbi:MAG: DUF2309 domain-containing protein [Proteobacteria bacterium]|nr:DUF2309 domain-containing protein [Pseudomonadota bacterium]
MIELHMNRVQNAMANAAKMIPPAWPLASSVAVNPFLGQTNERLASVAHRHAKISGVSLAMPRAWYIERIASGAITDFDLSAALASCPFGGKPHDLASLKEAALAAAEPIETLPTIAELAAKASRVAWPVLLGERIGAWAGSYFDEGQALWAAPRCRGAWASWKAYASHDLTPELQGLQGFGARVMSAPDSALETVARAVARLGLSDAEMPSYFHQLLLSLSGWAQLARYKLWKAELAGQSDATLGDLLAIRIFWEEALYDLSPMQIENEWASIRSAHGTGIEPSVSAIVDEILQEAWERAEHRKLSALMDSPAATARRKRPLLQAAFCIDVRSEVFRRALEQIDAEIETIGFAGFFGIFLKHRRFASDVEELRLPVLLNPSAASRSGDEKFSLEDRSARIRSRAIRAWGRFKQAAVSSFAFVEASGPLYAGKLLADGFALKRNDLPDEPQPIFDPALTLDDRARAAETILRAMSLTSDFARLVVLLGHGANVVNNPHASGLHCGACGGYSGEVNARLLAGLLNDQDVRNRLAQKGIPIPEDTLFLAGLHDTTTDSVKLYEQDQPASEHNLDLVKVRGWFAAAGELARAERALILPHASGSRSIQRRSRDWAEIRPEWALARCKAFIAAPRARTAGKSLEGRAFLHTYNWKEDSERGFPVLELIMTAPVVVASWISLQYFGSTVAPKLFGSGNKLLHNVVGGVGVIEGNGGAMRAGLPWQSIHDGNTFAHDPLRLAVCIEAPMEAMSDVLSRNTDIRQLFDNTWMHLYAMDDLGRISHRYRGDLQWDFLQAEVVSKADAA